MALSPICTVNNLAVPQTVATGASVEIELATPAGVGFWGVIAIGCDETTSLSAVNATISINQTTHKATFTAPASLGSAVIFQSTVGVNGQSTQGAGRDVNGVVQSSYTTTFKVNVAASNGLHVIAVNETTEENATFGNIAEVNAAIRASTTSGGFVTAAWISVSAAGTTLTNANSGAVARVDTTAAAFSASLPASPTDGVEFEFVDATGQWATHNFTLNGNGHNVISPATFTSAATFVATVARSSFKVKFDGGYSNAWVVI